MTLTIRSNSCVFTINACILYLLLFCNSIWSLLLSADRILGSTRNSRVSSITGSSSFSWVCKVFTYQHIYGEHVTCSGNRAWDKEVSPCAAGWPPVLWTQKAECASVMRAERRAPAPTNVLVPDRENPTPAGTLGSGWLLKTVRKQRIKGQRAT